MPAVGSLFPVYPSAGGLTGVAVPVQLQPYLGSYIELSFFFYLYLLALVACDVVRAHLALQRQCRLDSAPLEARLEQPRVPPALLV